MVAAFGEDVLTAEGSVDRSELLWLRLLRDKGARNILTGLNHSSILDET